MFCSRAAIWMVVCFVAACGPGRPDPPPSIRFSTVPAGSRGGSDKLALIAGRATGARPSERIVLFAKSDAGVWWVQGAALVAGLSLAFLAISPFPAPATVQLLDRVGALCVAAVAGAVALLGPGALSLDARLFGRRELVFPHDSHQSRF